MLRVSKNLEKSREDRKRCFMDKNHILISIKTKYLRKIFCYKNTYMHQNKFTYTSRDATNSDILVYCFS